METWGEGGEARRDLVFVCVTRTMIVFSEIKSISLNVNDISHHKNL